MKKIQTLSLVLACLLAVGSKAQNQDYYLYGSEQVPITKIAGKYLVEFPNGLYSSLSDTAKAAIGKFLYLNTYLVTDTSMLNNYAASHKVAPTYQRVGGNEIYYLSQVVLKFKDNVSETEKEAIISNYQLTFVESSFSFDLYNVADDALQIANNIFITGKVKYAHPNFLTIDYPSYYPPDPYFTRQWYLDNWGQVVNDGKAGTINADIDALEAWDISLGDSNIIVAVMDEGVTANHPDLPDSNQVRLNGSNFAYLFDGSGNPNNPSPTNSATAGNNHGNACAGIIAAQHNNQGVSGIAPKCKIMPIKIPLMVFAPVTIVAKATDFAYLNGAKIINMSFGGDDAYLVRDEAIYNAINYFNCLVVASTGNNANHSATFDTWGHVQHPANSHVKGVISVAASDRNNKQADYSPYGNNIEIAAPSHTAYPRHITGETFNVWTIDIPDTFGYNPYRDTMKPVQLPILKELLPYSGINFNAYTGRMGGTSSAAPQVCGVAALMKAVNPCITNFQILDLLQATADKVGGYDYNLYPDKPGQSKQLGHGKLNAFKAVKAAQAAYASKDSDLVYIKDNPKDIGLTGISGTGGGDKSPDIWVRNSNDGLTNQFHESPEFSYDSSCYVYIRVRNKNCNQYAPAGSTSLKLKLYWSKASTWSSWPGNWNGSSPFIGAPIDSIILPKILAGNDTILVFKWRMINAFAAKTTNACLMARIEGKEGFTINPIKTFPGRQDLDVKENNNIAMRNLTVIDSVLGVMKPRVLVGNIGSTTNTFNIGFKVPNESFDGRPLITNEAEVKLSFDSLGWNILETAGVLNQQGIQLLGNRELLLKNANIIFNNVSFPADTRIPIDISFNFLIDNQTSTKRYEYQMSQAFTDTPDMVLGTESFEIYKASRSPFNAYAGADTTINKGDSISLYASQINESASYKWYDAQHNLLHSGSNYKISPASNTTYTLEVVSLADGFKDYDEVAVMVKQHFITSMSPNPATSQVTISYDASNASAANIMMLQANGTTYQTYTISPNQRSVSINTSAYPMGIYTVVLVCDGQNADAKSLQVN